VTFVHCDQTVGRIKMKLGMRVGLGPGHIVLDGDPAAPPPKGHSPHLIFRPYLLRPNGCMDQDATWYGARPLPRRVCWMGTTLYPPQKWGQSPPLQFLAHFYCGQMAACIKMPLGKLVWRYSCRLQPRGLCVRWGPSPPTFSAHVYYSY